MSGQGEKVTHNSNGMKPAGQGGGCIASGPFKDMKVNLGYVIPYYFLRHQGSLYLPTVVLWPHLETPPLPKTLAPMGTAITLAASSAISPTT